MERVAQAMSRVNDFMDDIQEQVKKLSGTPEEISALKAQQQELEQFIAGMPRGGSGGSFGTQQSPSELIVKALNASTMRDAFNKREIRSYGVQLDGLDVRAATIISAPALTPAQRREGFLQPIQRRLTIRDMLPVVPVTSGSLEYVQEASFTNGAAIQVAEGDIKGEGGATFELETAAVRTFAHWVPISRQVLSDTPPQFVQYIIDRLTYHINLLEEAQILNGDGTGSNFNGIVTQATAYSAPFVIASPTRLDMLRLAITQLQVANIDPTAIVLNPIDWGAIETSKATDNNYITVVTDLNGRQVAWRLPVVVTNAMTVDKFLVGDFQRGAVVLDRNEARAEISTEHSDYFVRNLAALLVEERIGLAVLHPSAYVYGDFGLVA